MKTSLYNQKAEIVGEIDLNPKIFDIKPSTHLLAEAVRIHMSNSRQGTSNTKTRGEVSGGGKKPWKQKGTGRARAGSIRSPIWRHGGVTFGPRANQNWELKMNKKAKTKALFMSLSDKVLSKQFIVVDQILLEKAKTKELVELLKNFRELGKKQMLLMPKKDDKLSRASKNIPAVQSIFATSLNVYDVLKADTIIALKDSISVIEKTYLKSEKR